MKHDSLHQQAIREITERLISTGNMDGTLENCPGMKERVARLIALLRSAMYPHIFGTSSRRGSAASAIAVSYNLQSAAELLEQILTTLQPERTEEETDTLILRFLEQIPEIKACLETDIQAAYDGDPAAMSCDEIMLAYPAFEAISIYRMAHRLYKMGIPMLPRMMTEYAHQLTGIDIHPGAQIGPWFFIDHGTGIVIGETTVIGSHVKLYQGVTLGGTGKEQGKRHPTIGNNVMISAGAKVLGSFTIGDNSKIGAGSVVLEPVPPNSTVVGVPGRVVKRNNVSLPQEEMDQVHLPDPVKEDLSMLRQSNIALTNKLIELENEVKALRKGALHEDL